MARSPSCAAPGGASSCCVTCNSSASSRVAFVARTSRMGIRDSDVFLWRADGSFVDLRVIFSKVLNRSLAMVELTKNQADDMVHGPCSYGCAYGAGPNLNKKICFCCGGGAVDPPRVACSFGRVSGVWLSLSIK